MGRRFESCWTRLPPKQRCDFISEKRENPVQIRVKTDHISSIYRGHPLHTVEVTGLNPVSPQLSACAVWIENPTGQPAVLCSSAVGTLVDRRISSDCLDFAPTRKGIRRRGLDRLDS